MFSWQMKNLYENLIVVFHYSKGVGDYKEDIVRLLSGVCSKKEAAMFTSYRKRNDSHEGGGTQANQKELLPTAEHMKV